MLVNSIRPHRYAAKLRQPGERYQIKNTSHARLYLALKWVEEVQEVPVAQASTMPKVATYQESPEEYRTPGYADYLRSDMQAERPKRKYVRKVKAEE